jgi:hypothetical protein
MRFSQAFLVIVRILSRVFLQVAHAIITNQNIGFLISLMLTDGARYSTNGGTGGGTIWGQIQRSIPMLLMHR